MGLKEKAKYYRSEGLRRKASLFKNAKEIEKKIPFKEISLKEKAKKYHKPFLQDNTSTIINKEEDTSKKEDKYSNLINLYLEDNQHQTIDEFNIALNKLNRKVIGMTTLVEVGKDIQTSLSLDEIFQNVMFACMGQLNAKNAHIFLINNDFFELVLSSSSDNGVNKIDRNSSKIYFAKNKNLIKNLIEYSNPISLKELLSEYSNEILSEILTKYNSHYISPFVVEKNLLGFILLDFSNKEADFELDIEDKSFLWNICNITAITIKNVKQYNHLESVLSHYEEMKSIINILKFSKKNNEQTVQEMMNQFRNKLEIDSYVVLKKNGSNYRPLCTYGNFDKINNENLLPKLDSYINEFLSYEEKWIIKNKINEDKILTDFFYTFEIEIPEEIMFVPLIHRSIINGLLVISINSSNNYFLNSPDFDYIIELIGILISYNLT